MSAHEKLIAKAELILQNSPLGTLLEGQFSHVVIEMAAQIAEFQKLRDAVLRYEKQGGRQPWRELVDLAKALAPAMPGAKVKAC